MQFEYKLHLVLQSVVHVIGTDRIEADINFELNTCECITRNTIFPRYKMS